MSKQMNCIVHLDTVEYTCPCGSTIDSQGAATKVAAAEERLASQMNGEKKETNGEKPQRKQN